MLPDRKNSPFVIQSPKHQINYFNQQYHLLIANKHKILVTYGFFGGLIEDLGERNETDEI